MKKKEVLWKWLNILYFGGGMISAMLSIIIFKVYFQPVPISTFGACLGVYFVVLGGPFALITNKWLLSNRSQDG